MVDPGHGGDDNGAVGASGVKEKDITLAISHHLAAALMGAGHYISMTRADDRFVSLQALYSLVTRDLELELVPVCLDQGLGILPWGPLAGGFLTGKYRPRAPWPTGTRLKSPEDRFPFNVEKGYIIVEELDAIARAHNGTVTHAALNYLLQKPGVTSVVFGARTIEQLRDNIRTTEWSLSPEEKERLDQLSAPTKTYPHWYFDIYRKDRLHR